MNKELTGLLMEACLANTPYYLYLGFWESDDDDKIILGIPKEKGYNKVGEYDRRVVNTILEQYLKGEVGVNATDDIVVKKPDDDDFFEFPLCDLAHVCLLLGPAQVVHKS